MSGFVLQDAPCSIRRASLERQRNEPILRTHEVSILSTPASSVLAISSSSTSDLTAGRQNGQPTAHTGAMFRSRARLAIGLYKYSLLDVIDYCEKKSNWSQRVQWSFLYRRYGIINKTQCRRERVRAKGQSGFTSRCRAMLGVWRHNLDITLDGDTHQEHRPFLIVHGICRAPADHRSERKYFRGARFGGVSRLCCT